MMPIREGETVNQFYSDKTFLTVMVDGEYEGEERRRTFEDQRFFSEALDKDNFISNFASNHFKLKNDFNNIPFEVEFKDFIMGAEEVIEETPSGKSFFETCRI